MHAQMTHIHPLTSVRRTRILAVPGTVNVRVGQKVAPSDIIAEVTVPTRHYMVDVFRSLGLKNPLDAEKLISRKPGDTIEKNDILAETGGMFSRVIRTPGPGKVVSIRSGRVLIEAENRRITLLSGVTGFVAQVIPDRGAVIEANGAVIQGVWGNGLIGSGPLLLGNDQEVAEMQPTTLGTTTQGAVLLAGYCSSADVLRSVAAEGIAGLILGSMPAGLIPVAEAQLFPIVVLGGFGTFGLDPVSSKVLVSNAGREVSLNAVKWDRVSGNKPEVLVTLPEGGEPCNDVVDFSTQQTVRVNSGGLRGKTGVIEKILNGLTNLPNGLRAQAASVVFENNEKAVIPLSDLDIIDLKNIFLAITE